VVVGHDLGGGVAQILAVTASDRVAGLGPVLERLPPDVLATALGPGVRTLFAHQERAAPFLDRFLEPWRRPGDHA